MKKSIFSALLALFFGSLGLSNRPPAYLSGKASPRVALGEALFFEKTLSRNGTRACASCHAPELAFTDGYRRSSGIEADLHRHNAPSLLNAAALLRLTWSDSSIHTFEAQMQQPFFGKKPLELGLNHSDTSRIVAILKKDSRYRSLFAAANLPLAWRNIETAISAYLHTLQSDTTDNSHQSAQIMEGKKVFFAQKTQCATCHPPPYYTLATQTTNAYFNIGLYQKYPKNDSGLQEITHKSVDNGKFRVPSLRQVAQTAPYMHDGSIATLGEVIRFFEQGGHKNRHKSLLVRPFSLSDAERRALLVFLYQL